MDMNINAETVRSERVKRAWSQEQLAAAAGLSLRTIQRIEKTGIAAAESVQALSAAFDLKIEELAAQPIISKRFPGPSGRLAAAFFGGALMGLLIASGTTA